jgi:hypothetical protein
MLGWIKQLFRKVQLEPIVLSFEMELGSDGRYIVTVSKQLNDVWEPVTNIPELWSYGYREETQDPYITNVLTEPDRQTLYALKSLTPIVQADDSLLVEMIPTMLRYLRSKPNVVEGAQSRQLVINDQPARLAAQIDFDPTTGVQIETGCLLQDDATFVPAREFTRVANDSFIKRGNSFWPVINDPDPIVQRLLADSPRKIALVDVPSFIVREMDAIKKVCVTSLSQRASRLRVISDKWTAPVVTAPQLVSLGGTQDKMDFQIEYRVADCRVVHGQIANLTNDPYYRYDETTWLAIDHPMVNQVQTKLNELGIERVENGYRLTFSKLDALKTFVDGRTGATIPLLNVQTEPPVRTGLPRVSPIQTRTDKLQRFVEVVPVPSPERSVPPVSVRVTYETGSTTFLKEAQRYRGREGNPVPHIPFMQYWPSYSSMNSDQQQWYFYWRSRIRRGEFLPTDLSYIFVHVYELLNLVELPDVAQAAARLKAIWRAYRSQHPKLDNYLPDWGGDLLAFKQSMPAAMNWWRESLTMTDHVAAPATNLIIHQYVQAGKLDEMSPYLWAKLTTYRPRNKFYQEHNQDGMLDRAYKKAIQVAETYWRQTANESVLEKFTSPTIVPMRKPLFASAMVGYSHPQEIALGSSRNYLGDARLSDHLSAVVKYAENILRKQAHFSSKLSGIHLDAELAQALETAFAPVQTPPPPIRITIDQARVASLHQESKVIGDLLESEASTGEASPSKALYTDLAEMRRLWSLLEAPYRLAIAGIFKKEIQTASELAPRLTAYSILPATLIDIINEKSLKLLGDRLIYDDDGSLTLAEDFLDELDVVVKETPAEIVAMPHLESTENGSWDDLFEHLTPVEIELVRIFADAGALAESEIGTIAKKYNVMANAALDGLSEKATDLLGHPPFYFDSDKWLLEDEDLQSLRLSLHPQER